MPAILRLAEASAPDAARMPGRPADLAVNGLRKAFRGAGPVLSGVDLEIRRGEAVALIGANGSGKSTLLRCALRLIEPDAGAVRLFGSDVGTLGRAALRRVRARVGLVSQRHNLVPRLSALSNVLHGAQARRGGPRTWYQGLARHAERATAMECLDRVGLAHLAGRRADQLSGGQSQRVAIARALMQSPDIMLADEPVASLDPAAGEEVMRLFVDLTRQQDLTLVFVSHDLDHALAYADRVIGLRGGRLTLDQPAARLDVEALRGIYG